MHKAFLVETEARSRSWSPRPRPRPRHSVSRPRRDRGIWNFNRAETKPRHYCASRWPQDRGHIPDIEWDFFLNFSSIFSWMPNISDGGNWTKVCIMRICLINHWAWPHTKTRRHWIQHITFAAETNAADTHTAWQYLHSLSSDEGNKISLNHFNSWIMNKLTVDNR